MLLLIPASHAVEGLLSAVILNISIGLITTLISAALVWVWGRARLTRRQRERAKFSGVSPGDTCRIVAPHAASAPRDIAKHDVFSIVELAKLTRDLKANLDVVDSDEGSYGVGDITEFCLGGPDANVRMQSHLARFLPHVSICPYAPGSQRSIAIVAAGREFLREPNSREYALVAKVELPDCERPLFLICGQTSITNRAAVSYLRDNYRKISAVHAVRGRWCVVLRVVAPSVYGHQMTELAADLSADAFLSVPLYFILGRVGCHNLGPHACGHSDWRVMCRRPMALVGPRAQETLDGAHRIRCSMDHAGPRSQSRVLAGDPIASPRVLRVA